MSSDVSIDDLFGPSQSSTATEEPNQEPKPEEPKPKKRGRPRKKKDESATDSQPAPSNGTPAGKKHSLYYFDLETIPDESRIEQFDLPKLPPAKADNLMSAEQFCSQGLAEMEKFLDENMPPDWWLRSVEVHEKTTKKPRAGAFKMVEKSLGIVESQRKTLSVTPEYCRIAAYGEAVGSNAVSAGIIIDEDAEKEFLKHWWEMVADVRTIVGFNVLGFDLPVILIRSALLDVTPSRQINLSPYSNPQVCDLMAKRWPRSGAMKLKSFAKSLGITVPADDVDGSQVAELFADESKHPQLVEYAKSDVVITREIHRLMSGFFWE